MTRPSADLMAEVFPTVPLRRAVEGRETLLSIDHARRLLGYEPAPPLGGPRRGPLIPDNQRVEEKGSRSGTTRRSTATRRGSTGRSRGFRVRAA